MSILTWMLKVKIWETNNKSVAQTLYFAYMWGATVKPVKIKSGKISQTFVSVSLEVSHQQRPELGFPARKGNDLCRIQ